MRAFATSLVILLAALASSARADEPWLVSITADFAAPVTTPQSAHYLPGGELAVAVLRPVDPHFAFGVRLFGGLLFDGPAPSDVNRVDPGIGSWVGAGLVLQIRPQLTGPGPDRASGLFLDLEAGGVLTGLLVRPELSATLGYGIDLGPVVLAPHLRVMHVVHWDDPIDDGQAVVLMAGLSVVLGEAHALPAVIEEAPLEVPRDTDGDGIFDADDLCIDVPEDLDGIDDLDGCPEDDVDGDGILDADDLCVRDPEDLDGLRDSDGCPEEDADLDGILDPVDACPEAPEVINGVEDLDGCPDEGLIVLEGDRVVLDDRVLFETNRAHVRHSARPLLRAIAELFLEHPEWASVRIEGHADERGDEAFNRELSERRAVRVSAVLAEYGIAAERMEIVGYGEARPREAGVHDLNRRVEFVMIGASVMVPASSVGGDL
jgi:outer membrane protein OmpA-like peptidoglycan-associated protein